MCCRHCITHQCNSHNTTISCTEHHHLPAWLITLLITTTAIPFKEQHLRELGHSPRCQLRRIIIISGVSRELRRRLRMSTTPTLITLPMWTPHASLPPTTILLKPTPPPQQPRIIFPLQRVRKSDSLNFLKRCWNTFLKHFFYFLLKKSESLNTIDHFLFSTHNSWSY